MRGMEKYGGREELLAISALGSGIDGTGVLN